MSPRFAFFDADCLEASPTGSLRLRPRMRPFRKKLTALYKQIRQGCHPMVFTTCCSGSMLRPGCRDDITFVPLDPQQTGWKAHLPSRRLVYLQKKTYGDPVRNTICRAFDMFSDNGNASSLIRELGANEWILFGNGLDLCVNSAVEGVLRASGRVTFLSDCMCPCSTGDGPVGTEAYRDACFARWRKAGAEEQTLDVLLQRMERAA